MLFRLLGLIVEPHEVTEEASPLPAGGAEGDFGGIRGNNALKRELGRHGVLSLGVEPRLGTAKPAVVRGHDSRCVTLVTFRRVSRTEALVQGVLQHGGAVAPGLAQHRGDPRDDVEGLAAPDHALELAELFLEPLDVDRRPRGAEDLRM